ncbi:MAG: hypothetical protein FWD76_04010, partial [Firmicutes bacterium]|nr:hypothetical protein [Bacillota bacterium]
NNAHFAEQVANGNYPADLKNPVKDGDRTAPHNMFMLYSKDATAYALAGPTDGFNVLVDAPKALQVSLYADTVGYGANILVRDNTNHRILATIEQIKSTNGEFKTYTVYLQSDNVNTMDNVTVEVWLGMGDNNNNQSKLSSGTVFVSKIALVDFADAVKGQTNQDGTDVTFENKLQEYRTALELGFDKKLDYALYSSISDNIMFFDRYQLDAPFHGDLKTPYNHSMTSAGGSAPVNQDNTTMGVFNGRNLSTDGVSNGFAPTDFYYNSENPFGIYMSLNTPTAAKLSPQRRYNLEASSYYKITARINADLTALDNKDNLWGDDIATESKGLGISLDGTNFAFTDIRDTRPQYAAGDNNYQWQKGGFKDFTFYVATNDSTNLSLSYTLGGTDNRKQWAVGSVYLAGSSATPIDKAIYDRETSDIDSDNPLENRIKADLGIVVNKPDDNTNQSNTPNSQLNAIVIPSVLFAVALIIAIVGVLMRKLSHRTTVITKPLAGANEKPSYDRSNAVLNSMEPVAEIQSNDLSNAHNAFDDDLQDDLAAIVTLDKSTKQTTASHNQFDDDYDTIADIHSVDTEKVYKSKTTKTKLEKTKKVQTYVDGFED